MLKFTKTRILCVVVGALLSGGNFLSLSVQARVEDTSDPLSRARVLRHFIKPKGVNYTQALNLLRAEQRNAQQARDQKREKAAVSEIERTLSIRAVYRKWQAKAKGEIRAGRLALKQFGYTRRGHGRYDDILRTKYHIGEARGYGCMMTEEIIAEVNGYNETMMTEIERRYGKGILEKISARADKEEKQEAVASSLTPKSKALPRK